MIIDSSALIAILTDEPDGPMLAETLRGAASSAMSAATLLESHIVMRTRYGEAGVTRVDKLLDHLDIGIIPVDEKQARIASEAQRRYGRGAGHPARLNYGDCFSYALASLRNEPLLFKGDDFIHTDIRPAHEPGPDAAMASS